MAEDHPPGGQMSYADGPDDENPQSVEQVIEDHPEPVADDGNPAPSAEAEEVTGGGE